MPHTEPPPESGLVWIVDGEGRHWTLWVSVEDGSPLASQPIEGPLWAEGDALWQWVEVPVERPTFDAPPREATPDTEAATGTATVTRGVLRELVEDASAVVVEPPDPGPVRTLRHGVRLEGSVGPFLFVSDQVYVEAWGAHGSSEARAQVWDLRTAGLAEVLTERERESLVPEARERARARLVAEGQEAHVDPDLAASAVELVALQPEWDLTHGLRAGLWFATSTCYACGDGLFGDYTRSVRVEVRALPERLGAHGRLPDWARLAAESRPGAQLMGFSRVSRPEPARILDSLRR